MTDIDMDAVRARISAVRAWVAAEEGIINGLQLAGEQLRDLEHARSAILDDIGDLLRQAALLGADSGSSSAKPDIAASAQLTGLAQPALCKSRDEVGAEGRRIAKYSNRYLAQLHASYGYGQHEDIDNEFWRRFPHLSSMYHLIAEQLGLDFDAAVIAYEAEFPDGSTTETPYPRNPTLERMRAQYRSVVDSIANDRHWPVVAT